MAGSPAVQWASMVFVSQAAVVEWAVVQHTVPRVFALQHFVTADQQVFQCQQFQKQHSELRYPK